MHETNITFVVRQIFQERWLATR